MRRYRVFPLYQEIVDELKAMKLQTSDLSGLEEYFNQLHSKYQELETHEQSVSLFTNYYYNIVIIYIFAYLTFCCKQKEPNV